MVQLYNIVNNGYKHKDTKYDGFELDPTLSNGNNQLYVNKKEKKLIYNTTGTHNLKDWGTNFYLGMGKLKDTKRYKDAHQGIRDAKTKYTGYNSILTGDSLGGAITRGISSKGDKVLTLNSASTIGEKTKPREENYRVNWDPVSLLQSGAKHMTTLKNKNKKSSSFIGDLYSAHVPSSIKNHNIRIA